MSPNCDLRRLPLAAAQWARQFPLSPPLPNFLADLSVSPRPYKQQYPSKAHRPIYMAMLAWLMRGGWVTQLCTFAFVVVWPEIVYEVEYALEAEDIARQKRAHQGRSRSNTEGEIVSPSSVAALHDAAVAGFGSGFLPLLEEVSDLESSTATLRDLSLSHSPTLTRAAHQQQQQQQHHHYSGSSSGLSSPPFSPEPPFLSPTLSNYSISGGVFDPFPTAGYSEHHPSRPPLRHHPESFSTTASSSSQPTAAEQAAEKARLERIADKAARELVERATAHARKVVPQQTAHPSINSAPHLAGMSPHIILDAKKATGKDSLYLSAIQRRLRERAAAHSSSGSSSASKAANRNGNNGSAGGNPPNGQQQHYMGGGVPPPPPPGMTKNGSSSGLPAADWDEKVANAWPKFWKYFNGRSALERIALQEDMKRKEVWNLLTSMSEYLLCVRHW